VQGNHPNPLPGKHLQPFSIHLTSPLSIGLDPRVVPICNNSVRASTSERVVTKGSWLPLIHQVDSAIIAAYKTRLRGMWALQAEGS
jgi:hypothetical protein